LQLFEATVGDRDQIEAEQIQPHHGEEDNIPGDEIVRGFGWAGLGKDGEDVHNGLVNW